MAGASARPSSSPTATASRVGASVASGPSRLPVRSATTAVSEKTVMATSPMPAPPPACLARTARSSESTGSRTARRAAASTTPSTARTAARAASRYPSGTSIGTDTGKTTQATRAITNGEATTPAATPPRVSGSSSERRYAAAPRRPRPRSRASASSGPPVLGGRDQHHPEHHGHQHQQLRDQDHDGRPALVGAGCDALGHLGQVGGGHELEAPGAVQRVLSYPSDDRSDLQECVVVDGVGVHQPQHGAEDLLPCGDPRDVIGAVVIVSGEVTQSSVATPMSGIIGPGPAGERGVQPVVASDGRAARRRRPRSAGLPPPPRTRPVPGAR